MEEPNFFFTCHPILIFNSKREEKEQEEEKDKGKRLEGRKGGKERAMEEEGEGKMEEERREGGRSCEEIEE